LPLDRVRAELGDTTVIEAPVSGGSQSAAAIVLADGRLSHRSERQRSETFIALLRRQGKDALVADGSAEPGAVKKQFSMHSFGAHFVKVGVDLDLGEIRDRRHVGASAASRILNAKTARSQMIGGIVFGMGMALAAATEIDPNTARIAGAGLADYLVPVHLDVPDIEAIMVPEEDDPVNAASASATCRSVPTS
jgi:xanthine dehydrogenase YagR molybdenum-binding subunit